VQEDPGQPPEGKLVGPQAQGHPGSVGSLAVDNGGWIFCNHEAAVAALHTGVRCDDKAGALLWQSDGIPWRPRSGWQLGRLPGRKAPQAKEQGNSTGASAGQATGSRWNNATGLGVCK